MELSSDDESDFAKPEKLKADLQKKVNNFHVLQFLSGKKTLMEQMKDVSLL